MSGETDDEIEASRAPLLDHLVELRSRLIVCVIALFAAFIVCFAFSQAGQSKCGLSTQVCDGRSSWYRSKSDA